MERQVIGGLRLILKYSQKSSLKKPSVKQELGSTTRYGGSQPGTSSVGSCRGNISVKSRQMSTSDYEGSASSRQNGVWGDAGTVISLKSRAFNSQSRCWQCVLSGSRAGCTQELSRPSHLVARKLAGGLSFASSSMQNEENLQIMDARDTHWG